MVAKAYGMGMSKCTRLVLMTCYELGVEYELHHVDLIKGEQKSPEYIENMQPFGIIPVLIDEDGTRIYESRAISRYLTVKYRKDASLIPPFSDPKAYGLFEQAASIEYSTFNPAAGAIYLENLHAELEGREPDAEVLEKKRQTLLSKLEAYERILSKQKYLAGDGLTLADLFHVPYGKAVERYVPGVFDSQPNVKRWWADITARESWKAVSDLK
ncbi:glutathione [Rhizoctonia solani]|uniref:glutathione transferase n=1 Tax=Rhizoctonia solani TaxID=456999 RepID=A0A8H7M1L5_9AGAM|nr:glutathione [Rhizoctonia solani]